MLCVVLSKVGPLVEGSTSPFIDEGDGFTNERARVRILPYLIAHVYLVLLPILVGAKG